MEFEFAIERREPTWVSWDCYLLRLWCVGVFGGRKHSHGYNTAERTVGFPIYERP